MYIYIYIYIHMYTHNRSGTQQEAVAVGSAASRHGLACEPDYLHLCTFPCATNYTLLYYTML